MNGWHRFGILLLCCFLVMVCFPNYDSMGWSFIGITILGWTIALLVITLITNVFGLNRVEGFNRVVTLVVLVGVLYTLLWYFPQTDKVTPINRLKYGEYPTWADIDKGLKRLTFNFDFVRRNVRREENYKNQELEPKKKQEANRNVPVKEESSRMDITVE